MTFKQYYSSSKGNLFVVEANTGERLIIDPGVTWRDVQSALSYDLSDISGCLLSHNHADHSKSVKDVMQAGIDVYSSQGTFEALQIENNHHAKVMTTHKEYHIGPFDVWAYNSNHDAPEPFLFKIRCDDEYMLYATDTSHINQYFHVSFSIIAIECSYNEEYLAKRVREKTINEVLAKRLLTSHMSEKNCFRYLSEFCNLSKCHVIHLLHLSADNINKKRIVKQFRMKLFIEIRTVDDDL